MPRADIGMASGWHRIGTRPRTSGLGGQTVHPSQWDSFIALAMDQARRYSGAAWNRQVVPYLLLEE